MSSQREQGDHSPRLEAVIQVGNVTAVVHCVNYSKKDLTCLSRKSRGVTSTVNDEIKDGVVPFH